MIYIGVYHRVYVGMLQHINIGLVPRTMEMGKPWAPRALGMKEGGNINWNELCVCPLRNATV